jgi:hypothetical protein
MRTEFYLIKLALVFLCLKCHFLRKRGNLKNDFLKGTARTFFPNIIVT